jgi:hypothetical protein
MECATCGNELDEGEVESPYVDEDGNPICDYCYDDTTFTCGCCEERESLNSRGRIGGLFVSTDETATGIPDGIYEVVEHPFYADGMIEMHLYKDAVRKLSDDTRGIVTDPYPMAFLCEECAKKIRLTQTP